MPTSGPIRVIVVDDNPALRLVVQSLLKRHPRITMIGEAHNGEEALALVEQVAPDVVIMDVRMPTMNGVEATRCIKAKYPSIVVIGLTLNDDLATISAMQDEGASAVLRKERVLEDLTGAILEGVGWSEHTEIPSVAPHDTLLPADSAKPGLPSDSITSRPS